MLKKMKINLFNAWGVNLMAGFTKDFILPFFNKSTHRIKRWIGIHLYDMDIDYKNNQEIKVGSVKHGEHAHKDFNHWVDYVIEQRDKKYK